MPAPPTARLPLAAAKHYAHAQQLYSKAIEADPTSAVLYGNRAFAAIRLEVRTAAEGRSHPAPPTARTPALPGACALPCVRAAT